MAASIVRGRTCFRLPKQLYKTTVRYAYGAPYGPYYVLVPEVPDDTPETSPLLQYQDFPKFTAIKPDNMLTGGAKSAIDYDIKFGKYEENLKDQQQEKTFETVFDPLEEIGIPLSYAYLTALQLRHTMMTDHVDKVFQRISSQSGRVLSERWLSEPLYNAVKEVSANSDNLTEYQKRLVEIYEKNARFNGIELKGVESKKIFEAISQIGLAKYAFRNRVEICEKMFSQTLHNFNVINDMPDSLKRTLSEDKISPTRGPWKVTIKDPTYTAFMLYCNDRMTRWNIWHAHNNRASQIHASVWLDNIECLEKLRMHRDDLAKCLGYENFIEYSMESKMAGSLENVVNLLDTVKNNFHSTALEEMKNLQDFAESERFSHTLQMWDVPYFRRKQLDKTFRLQQDDISEYFPLPKVLNGLFDLCFKLFGVKFQQRYDCDTWHSDVTVYDVMEEGQYLGTFYMDLYARPQKALGSNTIEGRVRSDVMKTKPLAYVILNIQPPYMKDQPTLMTTGDVNDLFYQFGKMLQLIMTKVPYGEISSQSCVEIDAVSICPLFMKQWLNEPEILQSFSSHFDTGERLGDNVVERILEGRKHMFAFDMMHECYLSAYDLELHMGEEDWDDTMKKAWEIYMPIELDQEDRHPCSMIEIFGDTGDKEAACYSYLWSLMAALDIFDAFKEGGLHKKDNLSSVGKRFRDTYLAHGGGVKASEVFRQFRGRDPSVNSLLRFYASSITDNRTSKVKHPNLGIPVESVINP